MTATFAEKINHLPNHLQDDVEQYVDFLIKKYFLEDISLSDDVQKALDERKSDYLENKDKSLTISELKNEMLAKYGI